MPLTFGEQARKDRDRRLRRSVLEVLYLCRGTAPLRGISGRAVRLQVDGSVVSELRTESDRHLLELLHDLQAKGLINVERGVRRKNEDPTPDTVFARITDAGSRLYREEAAPDPDVYDPRATGDEE